MAEKHDLLDDIIDITNNWGAVSKPVETVMNGISFDPETAPQWDPSKYKERPRPNSVRCLSVASKDPKACTKCQDVCPVDAISITETALTVNESCRKCGLCAAVCPTEAFLIQKLMPKTLYNSIAKQAASHDHVYITCTRALGRIPKENEIVLPCVGALSKELWFSLFMEYDNISVYLPLGVCDRCRTTTGEEAYTDAISYAEELTGAACGLEVDEKALDHEYSRAYKRSQFLGQVARTGTSLVAGHNAAINGAQAVAQRIQNHTKRVNELTRSLEQAVGVQNSQHHRRMLTQRRELVMAALQKWPEPAKQMKSELPTCDMSKCTMCGDCTEACVLHAIELDRDGKIQIEPAYCIGCGVCARVCKEGALEMHPTDGSALVVPDPHAEEIERERAEVRKLKQQGKKVLDSSLKALGDTFGEDSSSKK